MKDWAHYISNLQHQQQQRIRDCNFALACIIALVTVAFIAALLN